MKTLIQHVIAAIALTLSIALPASAQKQYTRLEYIAQWADVAIEHMEIYGIPASITMAQAILESGVGNSELARTANNHFGIKCGSEWSGDKVYHDDDEKGECFRSYPSATESFNDHAEFLHKRSRYQFLFDYSTDDYINWAKGLKQAGYATSPTYAEKLIRIIEEEHLYLLDRKHGRKLYDEYVAERLGLSTAKTEQNVEVETPAMEEVVADATTAYADYGIDPNNFRVTINSHMGYNVYRTNGSYYIIAHEGDSYTSLAKLFDLSPRLLSKFNDTTKEEAIAAGDIIYIERKSSRWFGNNLIHRSTHDESLRLLSQVYGIRLKNLAKMNNLDATAELKAGDSIRLR